MSLPEAAGRAFDRLLDACAWIGCALLAFQVVSVSVEIICRYFFDISFSVVTPLNGFLAGVLLGFDDPAAGGIDATYRVDIDSRRFEFAVRDGRLGVPQGPPAVTVTTAAADLIAARMGSTPPQRKAALERLKFDGDSRAVGTFRRVFQLG